MLEITNVGAAHGGDCFLIDNGENAVLIDSGFAYCAGKMIGNIKAKLGERGLDAVLLTHSHYDHASGSVYCRREWPGVVIYAHPYAQRTFTRESALKTMREMNENAAELAGVDKWEDLTDGLSVDIAVTDGDTIEVGDMRFTVLETPGHTRDSISFYCAEEKLLIAAETLGAPADEDTVMPCDLVGWQMSVDAIERAAKLDTEILLTPHYGPLYGAALAEHFFESSRFWIGEEKRIICEEYRAGKSFDELLALTKKLFYVGDIGSSQPEKAFLLNHSIAIKMIIRECLGEEITE